LSLSRAGNVIHVKLLSKMSAIVGCNAFKVKKSLWLSKSNFSNVRE
jgi:hypothetical protein